VADQGTYEIIEHTADAGVAATGATKADAFANIAAGMYSLLADPGCVEEREQREITVAAQDDASLLEKWLLELLFLTETELLLFRRFDVMIEDTRLHAITYGEPIDRTRHELRGDIKGVTKHMTAVEESEDGFRARVLLDM
jgi:SHS2 domain-containing protein